MNVTIKNKAVCYYRVSTEDQANEAYGLESQRKVVENFCSERGWSIDRIFEDCGVSGWKKSSGLITKRCSSIFVSTKT